MKLSELKEHLGKLESVNFKVDDDGFIPQHFHVTEVGVVTKDFIDCGGTSRSEKNVTFQLWVADDFDHRLSPEKFLSIIKLSEEKLVMWDYEVVVEYQSVNTIEKYGLRYENNVFCLTAKQTDCLAKEKCGIPVIQNNCCSGNTGCC